MDFEKIGIILKSTHNQQKVVCPKCSHKRKKKDDPCLSVNINEGTYHCFNCGWKGRLKRSVEDKVYAKPPAYINKTNLSQKIVDYFKTRSINQQTLIDLKVGEGISFMPKEQKEVNCIMFNYFIEGQLVNIKYRSASKSFKLYSGAQLIFYNIDSVIYEDEVYIVEGEIDALTLHEIGIKNVISVPNGANKGTNNMEYMQSCYELLEGKKFIICTDNDEPGISLRNELARRLDTYNCYYVEFDDCKDANEYLVKYGSIKLYDKLKKDKKEFPVSGIVKLKDFDDNIEDIYINGYPELSKIGIQDVDDNFSVEPGFLTIVTGIPGHGKSEVLDWITCAMAVNNNWKIGFFSPENYPLHYHGIKLMEKIIGKRFTGFNRMTHDEKEMAKFFINENFFFIRPEDESYSIDNILEKAKLLVIKFGIKALVLDPYNKLENNMPDGASETNFISKTLDKIIFFAQKYGVHVFLVAHPVKPSNKDDGKPKPPTLYSIAGSHTFNSKADLGLVVYRDFETGTTEIIIDKVRFSHMGKVKARIPLIWNKNNSRYTNDNSNWLLPKNQNNPTENDLIKIQETTYDDNEENPF